MNDIQLKKTPLYDEHLKLDGKMVPFAGFCLPVQYKTGVIAEHMAVREKAGIFDVSHMGEVIIKGKNALCNLNYIMTNSFDTMENGTCRYTLMLNEDGTQVDDLIVYKMESEEYLLVLNASNTDKDIQHILKHLKGDCTITDISDKTAQIALQGPQSHNILKELCSQELPNKNYTFKSNITIAGVNCLVSRTGYTGEFGYELYMDNSGAKTVWQKLLSTGAVACGLGARDTLRLEASMPLYGHELSDKIHAMSTGLNFAIKTQKQDFIGKSALENPPQNLPVRVGLKAIDKGIVRENESIFCNDVEIGITTSGTYCPHLGAAYAMAYVQKPYNELGKTVYVNIRGRKINMSVVALPFYKLK